MVHKSTLPVSGGGGGGNVTGPVSAINGDIVIFNGATGKIIADSGYSISSIISTILGDVSGSYIPYNGANQTADFNGQVVQDISTLSVNNAITLQNGLGYLTFDGIGSMQSLGLGGDIFINSGGSLQTAGGLYITGGRYNVSLDGNFFKVLPAGGESNWGYAGLGDTGALQNNTFWALDDGDQTITSNAAVNNQHTSQNFFFTLSPTLYNNFQVNSPYYPNGFFGCHSSGQGYAYMGDYAGAQNSTSILVDDEAQTISANANGGYGFSGGSASFVSAINLDNGIYNNATATTFLDGGGGIYHYNGNPFSDGGYLYYPTGQVASTGNDWNFYGQLTQNGNIFVDTSGYLHTPSGLKDNSSSLGSNHAVLTSTGSGVKWSFAPGTATLVSGTKAITVSGVASTNFAFVQLTTPGGTLGNGYKAVCTTNTLTITSETAAGATQTLDTSTLNYFII